MTPEEFKAKVEQIVKDFGSDTEAFHSKSDDLMENLLIELGFSEGIAIIQDQDRSNANDHPSNNQTVSQGPRL